MQAYPFIPNARGDRVSGPVIVNNPDGNNNSTAVVVLVVLVVVLILLWWFLLGPGAGSPGSVTPTLPAIPGAS
jgi:hypothetical protein